MKRQNDKRTRLINGADQLFHQQGIRSTTLANIAQLAEVPLGNVYYYFKSKESIILAVIDFRLKLVLQLFEELNNTITNPKERIEGLLNKFILDSELITKFGDPIGSLCLELSKENSNLYKPAATLMENIIAWCENQFKELGKQEQAKQLAIHFVAKLQGISLLAATFKNPDYLKEYVAFTKTWLASIS